MIALRLLSNGMLDGGFGTGGILTREWGGFQSSVRALALDGVRIVALHSGYPFGANPGTFAVTRLLTNGSIEPWPDALDRHQVDFPGGSNDEPLGGAVGGGYFYMSGLAYAPAPASLGVLGRMSLDGGIFDTSFGDGGWISTEPGSPGTGFLHDVIVAKNGSILVCGGSPAGGIVRSYFP